VGNDGITAPMVRGVGYTIVDSWLKNRAGWWYTYPSEKYEFVSWDDDIPNIWENNPNAPNHQPEGI